MDNKAVNTLRSVLWGAGIILLLAAAFDVTSASDNMMIFLALACFVVSSVIKRCVKAGGCCK